MFYLKKKNVSLIHQKQFLNLAQAMHLLCKHANLLGTKKSISVSHLSFFAMSASGVCVCTCSRHPISGRTKSPRKSRTYQGKSAASPYRCLVYYVTSGDDSCRTGFGSFPADQTFRKWGKCRGRNVPLLFWDSLIWYLHDIFLEKGETSTLAQV